MKIRPAGWTARLWGWLCGKPPAGGYPLYVGLVMNLDRARLQRAVAVGKGLQSYHSTALLGPEWADAVAEEPEEVDRIASAADRQRLRARANRGR